MFLYEIRSGMPSGYFRNALLAQTLRSFCLK